MRIIKKATSEEQKFLNRLAYKKMLKDVFNNSINIYSIQDLIKKGL